MRKIVKWGVVAVLATMLAGSLVFVGCGGSSSISEGGDDIIPPPPSQGVDVSMGYNGSRLTFNVGWPGMPNRSIASKTRKIEFAITGPLIANPPIISVEYPDTIVRIDAPAGPGRYLRATEYDTAGELVKRSYVYLGLLDPNTPRTGLNIVLLDEHFTGANNAGVAVDLELGEESPFLNINTNADIDLDTPGTQNVTVRFYRIRVEEGNYYTFRLMIESAAIATANRIEITMISTDGVTEVTDGEPIGTEDTGPNPKKQSSATSLADIATSATITSGRTIFLRVRIVVEATDVAVTTGTNECLGKVRVKHETVPVGG